MEGGREKRKHTCHICVEQESFNTKIILRKFLTKHLRTVFFVDFLDLPEIINDIKTVGREQFTLADQTDRVKFADKNYINFIFKIILNNLTLKFKQHFNTR